MEDGFCLISSSFFFHQNVNFSNYVVSVFKNFVLFCVFKKFLYECTWCMLQ